MRMGRGCLTRVPMNRSSWISESPPSNAAERLTLRLVRFWMSNGVSPNPLWVTTVIDVGKDQVLCNSVSHHLWDPITEPNGPRKVCAYPLLSPLTAPHIPQTRLGVRDRLLDPLRRKGMEGPSVPSRTLSSHANHPHRTQNS